MIISILIPCYNEKKTIKKLVNKVYNLKIKKEVIIVDDGSKDGTADILRSSFFKKKNTKVIFKKKNEGKGSAIISGLKKCNGQLIAIQDADLEYNPKDLLKIFKKFNNKNIQVVYGSRVLGRRKIIKKKSIFNFRVFANFVLTLISNIINSQKLTDAHTCYKVFKSDILKKINLREKRFSFCPEITTKLSNKNIKIIEVPISYKGRGIEDGKKIRFIDALSALFSLIKYKFILRY